MEIGMIITGVALVLSLFGIVWIIIHFGNKEGHKSTIK